MNELNPNHPVTRAAHDHWHKIAALLMRKFGVKQCDITQDDIAGLDSDSVNIVLHAKLDRITVRLVGDEEARALARKEGGLPV